MPKQWKPRVVQGGRRSRRRGAPPVDWNRYKAQPRWRLSPGEIGLMLAAGVFLGLAYAVTPAGEGGEPDVGTFPAAGRAAPKAAFEPPRIQEIVSTQAEEPTGGGLGAVDPSAVTIIDGDTFRYRGDKIRIADIDTPEMEGRCAYEAQLAARATARMEELLTAGPFEMHGVDRDEDQYGRKLRVVTRDGQSLGDQLVAEGLARTWAGRREPWC
ncbi:MAG TPA: thermonuclease family protein [Allosphingosinicella sp.]|uniref:thermonuclease family protein n=1 Tax=Allosphingosinicella sp. TaxID=2823234 RepID=UPI002ED8524E